MRRHPWPHLGLLLTTLLPGSLVACQDPGALKASVQRSPKSSPSLAPSQAESEATTPLPPKHLPAPAPDSAKPGSPKPSPSEAASSPSLPLRLGLALPASLVGAGQKHLAGEGQVVAPEGTRLTLGVGGLIVSNHSGSILSNHSASLIGHNGGSLLSDQGGTYRLAQSALPLVKPPDDPRFDLWEQLLFIDLSDQLLQAYAQAGPQLKRWVPFVLRPKLLPPPSGSPEFQAFLNLAFEQVQELAYTGILIQEGQGLRLWLVRLPSAGAKPSSGEVCLDLQAPAEGPVVARFRAPAESRSTYGLVGASLRIEHLVEGGLRFRSGDRSLPHEQMSAQTKLLVSANQPFARHRQGLIHLLPSGAAEVRFAEAQRTVLGPGGRPGPWGVRFIRAFGYAGPGQPDVGTALWSRSGEGPPSDGIALDWNTRKGSPIAGGVKAAFLDPEGQSPASPPAALTALLPAWSPSDEGLIPRMPSGEDRMDLDPALLPEDPPEAVWAAP